MHSFAKVKQTTHSCFYKLNEKWLEIGEPIIQNLKKAKMPYNPNALQRKPIKKSKIGEVPTYQKISKPFIDNAVLMNKYPQNPSFKIYVEEELKVKVISEIKE